MDNIPQEIIKTLVSFLFKGKLTFYMKVRVYLFMGNNLSIYLASGLARFIFTKLSLV